MSGAYTTPESVAIRTFDGVLLNRWMVAETDDAAIITDDEGAKAVSGGRQPTRAIGFRKSDVFRPGAWRDGDRPDWRLVAARF